MHCLVAAVIKLVQLRVKAQGSIRFLCNAKVSLDLGVIRRVINKCLYSQAASKFIDNIRLEIS